LLLGEIKTVKEETTRIKTTVNAAILLGTVHFLIYESVFLPYKFFHQHMLTKKKESSQGFLTKANLWFFRGLQGKPTATSSLITNIVFLFLF